MRRSPAGTIRKPPWQWATRHSGSSQRASIAVPKKYTANGQQFHQELTWKALRARSWALNGRAGRQTASFQAKQAFSAVCAFAFSYLFDSKNRFQAMPHVEKISGRVSQGRRFSPKNFALHHGNVLRWLAANGCLAVNSILPISA